MDQKTAMYTETYVDYTNSLAKYMYLLKGIEHHFLFDYQVQQVVEWDVFHPGGECGTICSTVQCLFSSTIWAFTFWAMGLVLTRSILLFTNPTLLLGQGSETHIWNPDGPLFTQPNLSQSLMWRTIIMYVHGETLFHHLNIFSYLLLITLFNKLCITIPCSFITISFSFLT